MNNRDFTEFKDLLVAEREQLISELERIAFRDDENPADWVPKRPNQNISDGEAVEELELAEEIEQFENNTATVKELERRLNEVLAAITRIDDETYGVDEVSGEEISIERLRANPAARSSVENAPHLEREALTENELD